MIPFFRHLAPIGLLAVLAGCTGSPPDRSGTDSHPVTPLDILASAAPATATPTTAAVTAAAPAAPTAKPALPPFPGRNQTVPLPGTNLALGRPYTMSVPPNYPHCTDPGDATQLTDGLYAQGHFWTCKEAVGWWNAPRVDLVVDLGESRDIGAIAIDVAGNRSTKAIAGVSLPDAWFMISEDGRSYRPVGAHLGLALADLPDSYVRRYRNDDIGCRGRYVAVILVANGQFDFIDEIEVLAGTTTAAPAQAPVPTMTLQAFGAEIARQRGGLVMQGWKERASAARKTTIRAHLQAAGGEHARTLATLPETGDETPWLQANARLMAERSPARHLVAWNADPWSDYAECDLPPAGASPAHVLMAAGWDEHESSAVRVANASGQTIRLSATLGALTGPGGARLPAEALTVRTSAFVDCLDGTQRPDALPLLGSEGIDLAPGCMRQVWVGLAPGRAPAGTYRGSLAISGGAESIAVPVEVEVAPIALPSPLPLEAVVWGYRVQSPCRAAPAAAIRDQAAHYVSTAVFSLHEQPHFVLNASGTVASVDFKPFDTAVDAYRASGIRHFLFFTFVGDYVKGLWRPLGGTVDYPPELDRTRPDWWKAPLREVITAWAAHCETIGLAKSDYAFYPWDEVQDQYMPAAAEVWRTIRAAVPGVRTFDTTQENTLAALAGVADAVDVWCPHLARGTSMPDDAAAFFRRRKEMGSPFWLYNCQGPDKSFPPLAHYRRMAWQAWGLGAAGIGIWAYAGVAEGDFTSAWTDYDGAGEDFSLIYDAATAPPGISRQEAQIPSRRWEAFRDGIEDHAYLSELRRLTQAARARGAPELAAEAELAKLPGLIAAAHGDAATCNAVHARLLLALVSAAHQAR